MARKSQITVTNRAETAKTRNVALARRLASGNVQGGGTRALPLKEPQRWHTYIANTYLNESEFYDMKQKGWEPLAPEDLGCKVEDSGFTLSTDGYLVRGVQGKEMVFKMDKADYDLLVTAKTSQNLRGIGSAKKVKADIAEAAGSQLGDEAGSYINSLDGQVIDRITGGDGA
jgi:hypothetical protein